MQDEAVIVSQMSSKQVEVVVSKMDGSASRFPTREVVEREWGKDELRQPSYWEYGDATSNWESCYPMCQEVDCSECTVRGARYMVEGAW